MSCLQQQSGRGFHESVAPANKAVSDAADVLSHGVGSFNVTGTMAGWDLIIGRSGAGMINVNNGSDVSAADDTVLGLHAGSSGTIAINNAGSTWSNTGTLNIGESGLGTLNISAGVLSNFDCSMGTFARATGSAVIVGPDSTWNNGGNLLVGNGGEGAWPSTG